MFSTTFVSLLRFPPTLPQRPSSRFLALTTVTSWPHPSSHRRRPAKRGGPPLHPEVRLARLRSPTPAKHLGPNTSSSAHKVPRSAASTTPAPVARNVPRPASQTAPATVLRLSTPASGAGSSLPAGTSASQACAAPASVALPRVSTPPTAVAAAPQKKRKKNQTRTCEYCSVSVPSGQMVRHVRMNHEGERGFKCLVCRGGFNTKKARTRHMSRVHQIKPKRDRSRAANTSN